MAGARSAGRMPFMSASPLNRRSAALFGAELTQPSYQQRIAKRPLSDLAEHVLGPEAENVAAFPQERKRIVILGGGFAGMKTAENLEQELHINSSALITLISETNALLFTPM